MTGRFTETQIESARRRFRLSDLIARDGIKLMRHGSEFSGLCPFHSERSPSFTVVDGKGFYHCFGCGAHGDAIAWRMEYCGDNFSEAVAALASDAPTADVQRVRDMEDRRDRREEERVRASRTDGARALWFASVAIAGTPGEGYFRARGISFSLPPSLRWNPALIHGPKHNRRILPGIVAGVQNLTGQVIAVHRIYLDPASFRTGTVRGTSQAPRKALLGAPQGGAVRLGPAAEETGICEGIETGLAVAQAVPGLSVWAAIAAGFLPGLKLPELVRRPLVLADRDRVCWQPGPLYGARPGEHFARRAADEFRRQGRRPRIAVPPGAAADFNDELEEAV